MPQTSGSCQQSLAARRLTGDTRAHKWKLKHARPTHLVGSIDNAISIRMSLRLAPRGQFVLVHAPQ
jgi:hypothetical protein